MRFLKYSFLFLGLLGLLFLSGCAEINRLYDQPAYKPHDPSKVVVKVSLQQQMIYVMEGKRPLLVTACCVGIPSKPTPKGNFEVTRKERNKRSGSYGFSLFHGQITPVEAGHGSGHYVGYPMPYWVEFAPGYGFHQGWVWPVPRSHGCIRIHANDAGKFYELVHVGTPIKITTTQPEDATLGAKFRRPTDYNSPDQPAPILVSPNYFEQLKKVFLKSDG
ncbi:MAG: L,D-transpeptidase [Chthoniobacterales bacterium]